MSHPIAQWFRFAFVLLYVCFALFHLQRVMYVLKRVLSASQRVMYVLKRVLTILKRLLVVLKRVLTILKRVLSVSFVTRSLHVRLQRVMYV